MFEDLTLDDLVIRSSSHTPFFGVYLAAHAIEDALCMCHASVGCKVKTQQHLVGHDGVKDAHARRRYSQFIDEDLINGSTAQLEEEIIAWHRRQNPGLIILDVSTPISLQGMSMAGVIQRMEAATGAHVIHVDARNYEEDYLSGYARTIGAILNRLEWAKGKRQADEVSLLGVPFDRYEADQTGDVSELRRLLFAAVGLKAKAVFFAGEKYAALKEAVNARLHVLLPHAASQAKVLKSLGLESCEAGLPMSIAGTRRWLTGVAARVGAEKRATAFVEHETARVKPLLELAHRELAGRKFAVFADGPRCAGILATLMEVDMVPVFVGALHFTGTKREQVAADLRTHYGLELPAATGWVTNPTPEQVRKAPIQDCEIVIGPTVEREQWGADRPVWLERGFPSNGRHYLFPAPTLGFSGALHLLQEVMHLVGPARRRR
jgi:nitrogenase molybdenum-iron protein alpha/beta subunit